MYELLHHTADVRMRVVARDFTTLLQDAMRGLVSVLAPEPAANEVRRAVRVESADATSLVVDFLGETLGMMLTHREAYVDVLNLRLREEHAELEAEIRGFSVEAFGDDVKAVTYHDAELRKSGEGYEITIVLDI